MTSGFAAALRSFAAVLEVSSSARAALEIWHTSVTDPHLAPALRSVARRAALGAPIEHAVEPLRTLVGEDVDALAAALRAHQRVGGVIVPTITSLADAIEQRAELARQGRAASAAAHLSGRLLALLAIAFVVILPVWRDASTVTIVIAVTTASLFALAGARWLRALVPRPRSHDHPIASYADVVAASVAGGVHLHTALDVAATAVPDHSALHQARRRARLGMRWPDAFAASTDATMRTLGDVLDRSIRHGTSIRRDLAGFAAAVRDRERARFELRSRRAPVLMVLPLTLCLLPAFAIFVLVPLLRGLG